MGILPMHSLWVILLINIDIVSDINRFFYMLINSFSFEDARLGSLKFDLFLPYIVNSI